MVLEGSAPPLYPCSMRLLLLAAVLCLTGCSKTAMRSAQIHDAQVTDKAPPDVQSGDDLKPTDLTEDDHENTLAPDANASVAACSSLPVTWLQEPALNVCPPSATDSACAGNDVGAVVARSTQCVDSWATVPYQCAGWPSLDDSQEFVVLEAEDCSYKIYVQTLQACADHIQIEYRQNGTCSPCDGQHSPLRVLVLPRDPRPVVAVSLGIIQPPCLPPMDP